MAKENYGKGKSYPESCSLGTMSIVSTPLFHFFITIHLLHFLTINTVVVCCRLFRVVKGGPCQGMTVQKFDERPYRKNGWRDVPAQRVGVSVHSDLLVALYRNTIIDFNNSRSRL